MFHTYGLNTVHSHNCHRHQHEERVDFHFILPQIHVELMFMSNLQKRQPTDLLTESAREGSSAGVERGCVVRSRIASLL